MTYITGGLIEASDYNAFQTSFNPIWSTGSGDSGWGQTNIAAVSTGGTVVATNWATLVNNLSTAGAQTGTTITSRSAPTTGTLISILSNVATDITSCTTNRGNATSSGTEYGTFTGTTSQTATTGAGQTTWSITFTHTVTFPSADQARYFWNAGGRVRLQYGKSSTGTDIDPDWNTFAGQCGSIYITGRVNSTSQTIAGVSYTGTTRIGGSGGTQTALATTTGWYQMTGTPTIIFQLNNASSPYTGEYIRTTATQTSSTVLTLATTWYQPAVTAAGTTCNISGGTDTTSPSTTITGTAPTTLCTYFPPSTAQGLSASWGTPTINAAISTISSGFSVDYLVVAGGGGGGAAEGGGGGAGGFRTATGFSVIPSTNYTVTVGGGGGGGGVNSQAPSGSDSVFSSITSTGGGGAGCGAEGNSNESGRSGGSGGGMGSSGSAPGSAGAGNTPSTSPSQGNNGGTAAGGDGGAGGGGGAGAVGSNSPGGHVGGAGGIGTQSSISGTSTYYAGGGGGGTLNGTGGTGGSGGGAPGAGSGTPAAGTTNTGGGGGGGQVTPGGSSKYGGSAGGSGIVIIAYANTSPSLTSVSAGLTCNGTAGNTTPDTTSRAGYKVYTFTAGTGNISW